MNIFKLIIVNWDSFLFILTLTGTLIILCKRGEIKLVEGILFRLVTDAEKEFGSGTGELKKSAVIEKIYDKIPFVIRVLISEKEIEAMIENVLEYAKKKWAANLKMKEYIKGE